MTVPNAGSLTAQAWRDVLRVLRVMPTGLLLPLLALVVLERLQDQTPNLLRALLGSDGPAARFVLAGAFEILTFGVISAIAIRVHRLVLLGELPRRGVWRWPPNLGRFVATICAIGLAQAAVAGLVVVLPQEPVWVRPMALLWTVMPVVLTIIVYGPRLLLIFPAIAVRGRLADWRATWAASKGRTWLCWSATALFWVSNLLILVLPTAALLITLAYLRLNGPWVSFLLKVLSAVLSLLVVIGTAALLSRMLQAIDPDGMPKAIPSSD